MRTRFITSAGDVTDFPRTGLTEIAFLGRSNVGKSSLLNALVGARVARTSRTPGRTQLINFFEVHTRDLDYVLADLPGYGHAKAPAPVRARWRRLVERYLEERRPLRGVLFLQDIRRSATATDVALFRTVATALGARGGTVLLVPTKVDKLSKAALKPALFQLADRFDLSPGAVIPTSAARRRGLDTLRRGIEAIAVSNAPPTDG